MVLSQINPELKDNLISAKSKYYTQERIDIESQFKSLQVDWDAIDHLIQGQSTISKYRVVR